MGLQRSQVDFFHQEDRGEYPIRIISNIEGIVAILVKNKLMFYNSNTLETMLMDMNDNQIGYGLDALYCSNRKSYFIMNGSEIHKLRIQNEPLKILESRIVKARIKNLTYRRSSRQMLLYKNEFFVNYRTKICILGEKKNKFPRLEIKRKIRFDERLITFSSLNIHDFIVIEDKWIVALNYLGGVFINDLHSGDNLKFIPKPEGDYYEFFDYISLISSSPTSFTLYLPSLSLLPPTSPTSIFTIYSVSYPCTRAMSEILKEAIEGSAPHCYNTFAGNLGGVFIVFFKKNWRIFSKSKNFQIFNGNITFLALDTPQGASCPFAVGGINNGLWKINLCGLPHILIA